MDESKAERAGYDAEQDMTAFLEEMQQAVEYTDSNPVHHQEHRKRLSRTLDETYIRQEEKVTGLARLVLTLSLTALTLLVPMSSWLRITPGARPFLVVSVLLLSTAALISFGVFAISITFEHTKVKVLLREIELSRASGYRPGRLVIGKIKPLFVVATTSAVCFLAGIFSLSGALIQILLS